MSTYINSTGYRTWDGFGSDEQFLRSVSPQPQETQKPRENLAQHKRRKEHEAVALCVAHLKEHVLLNAPPQKIQVPRAKSPLSQAGTIVEEEQLSGCVLRPQTPSRDPSPLLLPDAILSSR